MAAPSFNSLVNFCLQSVMAVALVLSAIPVSAQKGPSPFGVTGSLENKAGNKVARFEFSLPPEHVLYPDRLKIETADGIALPIETTPKPTLAKDPYSGHEKLLWNGKFTAEVALNDSIPLPCKLVVKFQGCSNSICYFPDKRFFLVTASNIVAQSASQSLVKVESPPSAKSDWRQVVANFKIVARETGYQPPTRFLSFLDKAGSGTATSDEPLARWKRWGIWLTLGFILLGGAGLNLTPCVLPLIPINLAIIGAGAQAGSRQRGFLLGASYGAGMALAYGGLGLIVVLTGAKFGSLNASPWFNLGIAAVFALMALAMFDIIHIDFSRFQGGMARRKTSGKSPFIIAFTLGAMAALLAGACVAPVVISVLLLAAQLYADGSTAGLLLPFLLGLGMALPWPVAGAGLSFLPKPGLWMTRVKYAFGVLILGFAIYYGYMAHGLFKIRHGAETAAVSPENQAKVEPNDTAFIEALQQAQHEGKPVFLDFWASWCKNCSAMDAAVFSREDVRRKLQNFVVVKYQAEQPNEPPARDVLDYFGVLGLPTYVVLAPVAPKPATSAGQNK